MKTKEKPLLDSTTQASKKEDSAVMFKKFDNIISEHEGKARSFAFGLCRSRDETDDLFAEACVRLWTHIEDEISNPWGFFRVTITNLNTDRLRKRENQNESLEALQEEGLQEGVEDSEEYSPIMDTLLRSLTQDERTMIQMDADGFSNDEIADEFKITLSAAKSRLRRLRDTLQERYQALEEGGISLVLDIGQALRLPGDWQTAAAIARSTGRSITWVLPQLQPYRKYAETRKAKGKRPTLHYPPFVVEELRKLSNQYSDANGWLTMPEIARIAKKSITWVEARLDTVPRISSFRRAGNGQPRRHYPPLIAELLRIEASRYKPAGSWLCMRQLCALLHRHAFWIQRRLPQLKVASEMRIGGQGRVSEHWPPSLVPKLKELARVKDAGNWKAIRGLARSLKTTSDRVAKCIKELGLKGEPRRIPGSGKIFDHYPPGTLRKIRQEMAKYKKAGKWVSQQDIRRITGKSKNWVRARIKKSGIEGELRLDKNWFLHMHYPPSILKIMRSDAKPVPAKEDWLTEGDLRILTKRSSYWIQKQLRKMKAKSEKRITSNGNIRVCYSPETGRALCDIP